MENSDEEASVNNDGKNYSFRQQKLKIPSCQTNVDSAVLQTPLVIDSSFPALVLAGSYGGNATDTSTDISNSPDSMMPPTEEPQTRFLSPRPPPSTAKRASNPRANLKSIGKIPGIARQAKESNDLESPVELPDLEQPCAEKKDTSDVISTKSGDDNLLIDSYENYLRKLSKEEEISDESDFDHESESDSDSSSTSFSVSSLSGNDEKKVDKDDNGIDDAVKTIDTFEPLYSLPIKPKKNSTDVSSDSSCVDKNEESSNFGKDSRYMSMTGLLLDSDGLRTMSAPNLRKSNSSTFRTLDTNGYLCPRQLKELVGQNRTTFSSPELKKTSFNRKYRPLPTIPLQKSEHTNENDETIYEKIATRDMSESSENSSTGGRFSFKSVATRVVSLMPRLTTREARSREMDHYMADIIRYLPDRKLRIFVGTWNMKGIKVLPKGLDDYLLPRESVFIQDIYAIGCQEGTPFRKEWEICLQETLGPTHVLMYSGNFGVLQLSIFVRRELVWFCTGIEQDTVATRIAHKIKTKGALAVSFNVFGTSLLFINSHFASDQQKISERVKDYKTICRSLAIPLAESGSSQKESDVTSRFDRVFWFGDFNFRVNKTRAETDKIFAEKSPSDPYERMKYIIDELLPHDQLYGMLKKGKIFHGFQEAAVNFLPTYKFDVNTDTLDTSAKKRVPSWTDRILYKSRQPDHLKVSLYGSCTEIKCSDHRPVFAILEADIEPIKKNTLLPSAMFDREIYVEANIRRSAPSGNQNSSNVCVIL